ncbi:MAG TPA: plasmid pRiA4b ORF-3 family protein [Candidatus Chromulinivoraceae bacterium]|nr:plasmid pRiA4b ORF-3 family protein [Candidatus Chromulinivoraceae bacterium]
MTTQTNGYPIELLQLKISLRDSRPPIWRRIHVRADCSFWDLHSIIQDLFGWEDCHLHGFATASKINEDRYILEVLDIDPSSEIEHAGAPLPQKFPYPHNYYCDERAEKLGVWITPERKKMYYTYDFGDSWVHEIVLEKTITVESMGLAFCKYLGGKRQGVEEDSRGESILDCTAIIKAATSPRGEHWKAIVGYFGSEPKARQYLAKAERLSKLSAPDEIIFSDSLKRYKDDDATGMFDHS